MELGNYRDKSPDEKDARKKQLYKYGIIALVAVVLAVIIIVVACVLANQSAAKEALPYANASSAQPEQAGIVANTGDKHIHDATADHGSDIDNSSTRAETECSIRAKQHDVLLSRGAEQASEICRRRRRVQIHARLHAGRSGGSQSSHSKIKRSHRCPERRTKPGGLGGRLL